MSRENPFDETSNQYNEVTDNDVYDEIQDGKNEKWRTDDLGWQKFKLSDEKKPPEGLSWEDFAIWQAKDAKEKSVPVDAKLYVMVKTNEDEPTQKKVGVGLTPAQAKRMLDDKTRPPSYSAELDYSDGGDGPKEFVKASSLNNLRFFEEEEKGFQLRQAQTAAEKERDDKINSIPDRFYNTPAKIDRVTIRGEKRTLSKRNVVTDYSGRLDALKQHYGESKFRSGKFKGKLKRDVILNPDSLGLARDIDQANQTRPSPADESVTADFFIASDGVHEAIGINIDHARQRLREGKFGTNPFYLDLAEDKKGRYTEEKLKEVEEKNRIAEASWNKWRIQQDIENRKTNREKQANEKQPTATEAEAERLRKEVIINKIEDQKNPNRTHDTSSPPEPAWRREPLTLEKTKEKILESAQKAHEAAEEKKEADKKAAIAERARIADLIFKRLGDFGLYSETIPLDSAGNLQIDKFGMGGDDRSILKGSNAKLKTVDDLIRFFELIEQEHGLQFTVEKVVGQGGANFVRYSAAERLAAAGSGEPPEFSAEIENGGWKINSSFKKIDIYDTKNEDNVTGKFWAIIQTSEVDQSIVKIAVGLNKAQAERMQDPKQRPKGYNVKIKKVNENGSQRDVITIGNNLQFFEEEQVAFEEAKKAKLKK